MNTNLIDNRQIRVFISSTFQDMQDERDYLMKRTFPKLRKLAAERDVTLTELDLRWGITKEEAETGKVVEICLREIENSVPFFIGIIGNRYGWVPERKDIGKNVTERFADVNKYLDQHLSVTEMEMQFGVLQREEDMHAFFYIKEEEQEMADNPEMLERLKEEVRASRYPSATYTSPENLAEQVEEAFTSLLDQLFPEGNLSELDKVRIGQRSFMNQLCQNYIRDEKNFQVLDEWMLDWEKHQMVVTGASGLGKSALIANWVKEKLNDRRRDYNIIYHFTGNGGSESSHEYISKVLSDEIKDQYGWKGDEELDGTKLEDLFLRVAAEGDKPLLIVLDAINQIVDVDNAKLLNWLPIPPKKVKILFSTLEDDRTMEVFKNRLYPIFTLMPLDLERRREMVNKYLHLYAKTLTPEQVTRIVTDKQCENTLVLKTLLDELLNFGVYEKLDERIDYYLSKETIDDFYQALLESYEEEFDEEFLTKALSVIYLSQHGITERAIIEILNIQEKPLKWSQFYCSFERNFTTSNGNVLYSHKYISEAIRIRYITNNSQREELFRYVILDYIIKHFDNTSLFEIPYQLYKINTKESINLLYNFISKTSTAATLFRLDKLNIIKYWELLRTNGYNMNVYLNNLISDEGVDIKKMRAMNYQIQMLLSCCGENATQRSYAEKTLNYIINKSDVPKETIAAAYNDAANSTLNDMNHGDLTKAIEYFQRSIELLEGSKSIELANAYNGLAVISKHMKNGESVIKYACLALKHSSEIYGIENVEIATQLNTLAQGYQMIGDWEQAKNSYLSSINMLIRLKGNESEELAETYYNYADLCFQLEEQALAFEAISNAIHIIETIFGPRYFNYQSFVRLKNDIINKLY